MKILISGCSYTENQTWPQYLLDSPNQAIHNFAKGAAGNNYIASSITYNLDKINPDFVFVLWSGINRIDLRVANSSLFKSYAESGGYRTVELGQSLFFLGGGAVDPERGWLAAYNDIKTEDWPKIDRLQDWYLLPDSIKQECLNHKIYLSTQGGNENTASFCHQYFVTQNLIDDKRYFSELTFQHMTNCFNALERRKIPYRFGFIYDLWHRGMSYSHGKAIREHYCNQIDWSKFIDLPPFEYGVKHNLMYNDGYHLTQEGMIQWSKEVNAVLKKQSDLAHLFHT